MIFAADDYLYKEMVDLNAISSTAKVSDNDIAVEAPYTSSYGAGGEIKSSFHPLNGKLLHLTARCLGVLPAATDDGSVSIALYTNQWKAAVAEVKNDQGTVTTAASPAQMGTACDRLVCTYGPISAGSIRFDDGLALDTILPENLGSKIQLKITGTAFDKVSSVAPMLEVMIEEYSTVHGR